jgi:hypothetical protein
LRRLSRGILTVPFAQNQLKIAFMAKRKKPRKRKAQTDLSGMMGERVSVRKVNNRVVVTNRPKKKKGKLTEKLRAQRERFQEAVYYALQQSHDEEARALYAPAVKGKHESVYSVALGDFLTPPKVWAIDTSQYKGVIGNLITANAKDDFMVTKVTVAITSPSGDVIEEGEATKYKRLFEWQYTAVAANPTLKGTKIAVTAFDRPGNRVTEEIVL